MLERAYPVKNNRTHSRDVFIRCSLSQARRPSSYAIVKRRHVHLHKDDTETRPSRLSHYTLAEGTLKYQTLRYNGLLA